MYILLSKNAKVIDGKVYREVIKKGTLKQIVSTWLRGNNGDMFKEVSDFAIIEKER